MPLEVPHNVPNFAYVIEHEEIGKLVFVTDAMRFPYKLGGVNHLMIEANNSEELIIDQLCDNKEIRSHGEYHMEINETLDSIKRLINSELKNIVLIHLSDGSSDEKRFKQMIFDEVGIRPIVANKGVTIELNKEDF